MALNQQKLLVVVLILATIRFVLLPVLEWQAQKREQLQVTSQQLERAIRLKNSAPEQESQLAKLQQLTSTALSLYPNANQNTQFRLNIQQQLEQQLTGQGLEVNLFDWLAQQTELNGSIERYQIRMVLQGQPQQIMAAYMHVLINKPWLKVQDIQLRNIMGSHQPTTTATIDLEVIALAMLAEVTND